MKRSLSLFLLLLGICLSSGCTPDTTTNEGDTNTFAPPAEPVVSTSDLQIDYDSVWMYMVEGDVTMIPIPVYNVSEEDMVITTTVESDLEGFLSDDPTFPLTSGSSHIMVVEFDSTGIPVEIDEPEMRVATLVVTSDLGESHEVFVAMEIYDEHDYTDDQLSMWTTVLHMEAEAGGNAALGSFTVSSYWNEPVSYTTSVEGEGFDVTMNATSTLTPGSVDQVWVEYTPPATIEGEFQERVGLMTLTTGAGTTYEVTVRVNIHNPAFVPEEDPTPAPEE